ncbi:unnamed protein product, partial [Ectocarpus sp. 12 AP-2014]
WESETYRTFYNVNYPPIPAADVQGHKVAKMGWRSETSFGVEPHLSPSGRMFMWVKGGPQHHKTGPETDVTANLEGYISVTPLRADLTAHDQLSALAAQIDD